MKLLVLDTSSICQAALVHDGKVVAQESVESMKQHAEAIVPLAQKVLEIAKISSPDAVLVGTGPGPFTGLRAAITAGEMMAFAWNVPVYGLMSHYGFKAAGLYLTLSDAHRKEVYWCEFQEGELLQGPRVTKQETLPDVPHIGFDTEPRWTSAGQLGLTALELLKGRQDLSSLAPYYLREADVKVPGPRKRVLS